MKKQFLAAVFAIMLVAPMSAYAQQSSMSMSDMRALIANLSAQVAALQQQLNSYVANSLSANGKSSVLAATTTTVDASLAQGNKNTAFKKKTIIFSIDQAFPNGIIALQDMTSLQRMIATIKLFQKNYEVYALVNPTNSDQSKVRKVLDTLVANGIPFMFDEYSSDNSLQDLPAKSPYDPSHGIALSTSQLQIYKTRYGSSFAGIRFMEVFAENSTILACKNLHVNWCDASKQWLPSDNFYQKSIADRYIKFASGNNMFVVWSDFYWSYYNQDNFAKTVVKQSQNEQELKDLLVKYPNTVAVMFANNWPTDGARHNNVIGTWPQAMKPFVQSGAKVFGLSDQSWMCQDQASCPASELATWATSAFSSGATVLEFEPYYYSWYLPVGTITAWLPPGPVDYTKDPAWSDRGAVNYKFSIISAALGITIPNNQLPVKKQNNAACVTISAPDTVNIGQKFMAQVTFKNTGNKPWVAQNNSTSWDVYRVGATDFQIPPYTSSKWGTTDYALQDKTVVNPGDQTTFTLSPTATTTPGTYDFSWQMFEHGVEWFGATCGKTVTVIDPNAKNGAACVSVTAPDQVQPGKSFAAQVIVKNTGTKPWISQNSNVSWDTYYLGATDFQIAPYTSSKWGTPDYLFANRYDNPGKPDSIQPYADRTDRHWHLCLFLANV